MTTLRRPRETALETWVAQAAQDLGVPSVKLQAPRGRGRRGLPDRLFFIVGGRPLMHEYKVAGAAPEPLQEYWHGVLRDQLSYEVEVHDDRETALRSITHAVARARLRG